MPASSTLLIALVLGFAPVPEAGDEPITSNLPDAALVGWIDVLRADDVDGRIAAARAIAELGPQGEPAIDALVAGLADSRRNVDGEVVAEEYAAALARIGRAAVPAALVSMRSSDLCVFASAATVVNEISPPPPEAFEVLHRELSSTHPERVRVAALVLGAYGARAEPAVPALIAALDSDDLHVRYTACRTLAEIGPKAAPAVPRLLTTLADDVVSPRGHAALALGAIGSVPGHDVVPALLVATKDATSSVRERALIGLGLLGPRGRAALPALHELMADERSRHRVETAFSVWQIGGRAEEPVAVLVEMAGDFEFNLEAIRALGEIGPAARAAVPTLTERLGHEEPDVRFESIVALAKIDARGARPLIERAANEDASGDVRAVAKERLVVKEE